MGSGTVGAEADSSVEDVGVLRFRDLSWERRSFRAAAAASREAVDISAITVEQSGIIGC